jgi:type I restriction enzyme R subunit
VKAALSKSTLEEPGKTKEELDAAIQQIVSKAVVSDEVVETFSAAALKKPDISILSDEFLEEVRELPHRNLAVELLQRLLSDEVKVRSRKNVVLARSFAERLEESIRRYQNRSIATVRVIAELIELAKEMREG